MNKRIRVKRWQFTYHNGQIGSRGYASKEDALRSAAMCGDASEPVEYEADYESPCYPMISIRAEPRNLSHPSVEKVVFCGERMDAQVYRWLDPLFK